MLKKEKTLSSSKLNSQSQKKTRVIASILPDLHRGQLVNSQKGEEGGSIGPGLWPVPVYWLCPNVAFVIFGSILF